MNLKTNDKARALKPEDVEAALGAGSLEFDSTGELEPLDEILGQPRAMKALDLGLGIRHPTYNIYVAGLSGTGKKETIKKVLNDRVGGEAPPADWIYVHNFDAAEHPLAVQLAAGQGIGLRDAMKALVEELQEELPKAFRQEDFSREKQRISRQYEEKNREAFNELEAVAQERGMTVQQMANEQIGIVPLKDDRPMTEEEFGQLPQEEREEMSRRQSEIAARMESVASRRRQLKKQMEAEVKQVEHDFAARLINPRVDEIKKQYDSRKLEEWFEKVRDHMLHNLDRFRGEDGQQQQLAQMLGVPVQARQEAFTEYRVNPVVDNSRTEHAPVIIEESPNYKNLFGTTGGVVDRFGRVTGDFSHIRAGSLLRANGGYLVVNLAEALFEPLVWKELKRSIKSGKMEFHAYDPLGAFTASAIRPEPIPLDIKLVVLGSPLIYHLLHLYDEDFGEIFKVKADFATEMDRSGDVDRELGRFIRKIAQQESQPDFDAGGVLELSRTASRLAGNREKVTTEFSRLADVIREAGYWARQDKSELVGAKHVRRAVSEKVYRSDWIAAKFRELIHEGTLLISLGAPEVGQINGVAVVNLGDYAFGKPSRVTASVGVGAGGVVNIERESKLSGQTYDKAMLILDGYLRNVYAQEHPIALSAGITLEQSYGLIEGDSASAAELVCLLSAIARVPLRQDIAVTGSVNQWGAVQAVGGLNEKIEGFYDVCKLEGLTGEQGVCIPASNVRHLVLRPDVLESLQSGEFNIWAVDHVDQALALLSGKSAGEPGADGTFHELVDRRLRSMIETLKQHAAPRPEQMNVSAESVPPARRDPRPPMPGRE